MKQFIRITLVILCIFLLINTANAQISDDPVTFQLSDQHELTAVASGSLTWEEGSQEVISLNLTMSDFEFNNSIIRIFTRSFVITDSASDQEIEQEANTTQTQLTVQERGITESVTFDVPDQTDRFYINITLLAQAEGGGVEENQEFYSLRFPQDSTIIVQRDNIVPVVNLYGFPQGSFFGLWLPIYGVFTLFLLSPAAIFGVGKIKEMRQKEANSPDLEEENTEEELEDENDE